MPPSPTDGDGAGPSDPLASCERRGLRARRALISPSKHDRAAGVGGAVVAVLDGSGGGGAVSGLAASGPGPTASEWMAEWAPRAERAAARWTTPLPPQVAATVAAPRHRRPISRSCSTPGG